MPETIQNYWNMTNVKRMKLARDFAKQHNLKPAEVFMMLERITPPPAAKAEGLAQAFSIVELASTAQFVEPEFKNARD